MKDSVYYVVGLKTGKEGDSFEAFLAEFDKDQMVCVNTFCEPYTAELQTKMQALKAMAKKKNYTDIVELPEFKSIHGEYVRQSAVCIDKMCQNFGLTKEAIDAVGFYGEKLDCNLVVDPKTNEIQTHTLQMGSGKMLADLIGIKVVYDFYPMSSQTEKQNLLPENETLFLSTLNNTGETSHEVVGKKLSKRNVYRNERYEHKEYEYDDMLNDEVELPRKVKKFAKQGPWARMGNQGRFYR